MNDTARGEALNGARPRYLRPSLPARAANSVVARLAGLGISLFGTRLLAVRGRVSGQWRLTPVSPLRMADGTWYLVAPRGTTQWVRNLRAAGTGELRLGRTAEPFSAAELPDADKPPVLRAYLRHWRREAGVFFDGADAGAPEARLREIAPRYPVFRLSPLR